MSIRWGVSAILLIVSCGRTIALPAKPYQSNNQVLMISQDSDVTGVGFDLSLSNGVAAVVYKNGTYKNIATVDAGPKYIDMMKRLSLKESRHLHRPYYDFNEEWRDTNRQILRKARKLIGFPASADVGEMSRMISSLREKVQDHLGHAIGAAAVTWARDQAVYEEDMLDAMEYAGLESRAIGSRKPLFPWQKEWSSAIKGYDIGVNDAAITDTGESPQPHRGILTILYTKHALSVSLDDDLSFYVGRHGLDDQNDFYYTTDFAVGSSAIHENPDEAYFWERVRRLILERPTLKWGYRGTMPITEVVLLGESGNDPAFQAHVKNLVISFQNSTPKFLFDEPLYAAVRGAAWYCSQSDGPYPERLYFP